MGVRIKGLAVWMVVAWAGAPGPCQAQPDPPIVTSPAWFTWYQNLLSQRLAECPVARAQTFYFSQAGSDTTGDGSIANPWKSIAKARQVLAAAAPAGDVAALFRRGDTWRETIGLDMSTPNITIGDYGEGTKPLFTVFQSVGEPSQWSPTPGHANVYQRTAPARVMWAKQDDDLDRPWSRQRTVAGVNATEGSWCWLKGVLYVHPRHGGGGVPTDPRVDGNPYEVVGESGPGVRVRGDGSRVQNIRAQGWGITVQPGTQIHGIESVVAGADRAVIVGCESHYGLSHVMTHWSAQGGTATFVECKAGLTTFSADGGETMFNTFAYHGGAATIFDHCEATHGTLPSDDFAPGKRKGGAFYGHTNFEPGSFLGLTIAFACSTRDTQWGCTRGVGFDNLQPAPGLERVRCFNVQERFEGGPGTGEFWRLGQDNGAVVSGQLRFHPAANPVPTLNNFARGWVLNTSIDLDCTDQAGDFSFFVSSPSIESRVQLWNCAVAIRTRPGQTFRFDGAQTPNSSGSIVAHSLIVCTGGGVCAPNLGKPPPVRRRRGQPAAVLKSNAYFGVAPTETSADPYAVLLGSPEWPTAALSCASSLACGATPFGSGHVMGYDQHGVPGQRDDLGPVEVYVCANCDGSTTAPVLNIEDYTCFMALFTAGDPRANCDASTTPPVVTAADFTCFQEAFVRGCR